MAIEKTIAEEIKEILEKHHDPDFGTYDYDGFAEDMIAYASKFTGRQGGETTVARHGTKHFSEAGKKGMAKRWGVSKPLDAASPRGVDKETGKDTEESGQTSGS